MCSQSHLLVEGKFHSRTCRFHPFTVNNREQEAAPKMGTKFIDISLAHPYCKNRSSPWWSFPKVQRTDKHTLAQNACVCVGKHRRPKSAINMRANLITRPSGIERLSPGVCERATEQIPADVDSEPFSAWLTISIPRNQPQCTFHLGQATTGHNTTPRSGGKTEQGVRALSSSLKRWEK